ncbi:autotransporter outer membrane beta-barrel domain-containing protein [Cetobacterium somerae]|uniref:autotransporter outer membrane beta-barrel domain-containing protein n=1 Tax=Cetobacterium somerae TaxID=188913 RepID=UPI00248D8464|nr:autotransporter outer membrane beta-barrel domain-containing protein [Cetobacterium somerae]
MKKNKYLLLALLILSGKIHANDLPIISIPPETIEKGAYENILRVVDQINKKKGINSAYLEGSTHDLGPKDNGIDIVAMAHANDKIELTGVRGFYKGETYHSAIDIVENKLNAIDKSLKEKLPFVGNNYEKRFYFGNGNSVKDIIFKKSDDYNKTVEKIRDNKNEKYSIEGVYTNINKTLNKSYDTANPLDISMKDYREKIQGKPKEEVAKYLHEKLKENGVETELKNGELFTKNGKEEWRVLWDLQGVRIREGYDQTLNETVYTKIYTYEPKNEQGQIFYTKDSNMYIEDKGISKENLRITGGSYYGNEGKSLEDMLKDESKYVTKYSNSIEKLTADKQKLKSGEMEEEEFNAKWITPFKKGGEFEKALEKYLAEVTPLYENMKKYEKTDFNKYLAEYEKIESIQKEHGFFTGFASWRDDNPEEKEAIWRKWTDRILSDKNLILEIESKNIEFRGKGRVDGTIDLGEGYNKLRITEQFTGKYGTNIILGPYAKLKNIAVVEVGRAIGDENNPSLSGNHSLTLDIDTDVKDNKGHLIQHAFRDSDKDIEFTNAYVLDLNEKNKFSIEMIVSKIDEDSTINMGRPLETTVRNFTTSGEEFLKSKIKLDSDSIVHEIKELNKSDENGNSLVQVVVKDRVQGLDNLENEVYKSIKDAKKIGSIWETTTSTNKKTVFGGVREQEALSELKMLTDQMSKRNIYKYLNKISKNELNTFTSLPFGVQNSFEKDSYVDGGYISNRDVEDDFKGNVNTGYALYEKKMNDSFKIGGIFGGSTSNHQEIKKDSLDTVTTNSSIKGQSLYLGGYGRYAYTPNFNIISGIGAQYGEYDVNRKLKNNYQDLSFKSKPKTNGLNLYSGVIYDYPLPKDMKIGVKGLLSYSLIIQNSIEESKEKLALDIAKQNYNYLDGELGFNISKTLYSKGTVSQLSAGLSGIYGLSGYDNENMSGKIQGSTSNFTILGKDNEKESLKLILAYDVQRDSGITYGIEGDYLTNKERKNVTIGVKLGYLF